MYRKHSIIQNKEFSTDTYDKVLIESLRKYFTLPHPVKGKYVKLVFTNNRKNIEPNTAKTGDIEKNIICISNFEINKTPGEDLIDDITASSYDTAGVPSECINHNLKTHWHTKYRNGHVAKFPHEVVLSLKNSTLINNVSLITRQEPPMNGQPHDFVLWIADDITFRPGAISAIFRLRVNEINNCLEQR